MPIEIFFDQIHLMGRIDKEMVIEFTDKFPLVLSYPSPIIELHISSPGGELDAAEKIIAGLKTSYKPYEVYIHNAKIYGGSTGVSSAASVIASFADNKIIDHDATFMIHHARSVLGEINDNEEDIIFWIEKTGLDYEVVKQLIDDETFMDAEVAHSLGFVDDIKYEMYVPPVFI